MTQIARKYRAINRLPDVAQANRFRDALGSLTDLSEPVGLAVSGGPDSMAMLLLACAARVPVKVATVDHGLREESRDECALVQRYCDQLGVDCSILTVSVAVGNLQEQARHARYAALGKWGKVGGLSAIATAHHADDQAETLLMRLNRGSGLAGLSGIRVHTIMDGLQVPVIRPLLDFRRSELSGIVKAAGIEVVLDPSNIDLRFDRVRMRKAIAHSDWIDPAALAQSADHLAQAENTLQAIADHYWDHAATQESGGVIMVPRTDWQDINVRLVSKAIAQLGGSPSRGEVFALLSERLTDSGARANLAGVLVEYLEASYRCEPEPPRGPR